MGGAGCWGESHRPQTPEQLPPTWHSASGPAPASRLCVGGHKKDETGMRDQAWSGRGGSEGALGPGPGRLDRAG